MRKNFKFYVLKQFVQRISYTTVKNYIQDLMEHFGERSSGLSRSLSDDYQQCLEENQDGCGSPCLTPCIPFLDPAPCLRPWNFKAVMDCMFCKLSPELKDFAEAFCKTENMGSCQDNRLLAKNFVAKLSYQAETVVQNVSYETIIEG